MRDPERIDRILEKIRIHWKKHPDQRFWQILFNANRYLYDEDMKVNDPYYIEDDKLEEVLTDYFNKVDQ
jgi:hypothetical protein